MHRGTRFTLLTMIVMVLAPSIPAWAQNRGIGAAQGYSLPSPWGIGITIYSLNQPYDIVDLQVPLAGLDISAAEELTVQNSTDSYHLKFDYWLLPFLDIYVLGGRIDGTTTVELGKVDLGLPIRLNDIRVDYSGLMYGGGVSLAYGSDTWFATLTYDITRTDLDVTTSSVQGWVLTPRLGLVFDEAAIWVGAMYLQAEEKHEGVFEMPYLGAVPFNVELEQSEPWNYNVGMNAGLGKNWNLTFEGGFGTRKYVLANLERRFGK